MALPTFRALRAHLAPRWLTEGYGGRVGYALDLVKDAYVRRAELGHLARFPENGPNGETAPPDALAAIGRDRRLVRGRTETDAEYAARLVRWLDDRRTAGTPFALAKKIAEYVGGSGVVVKTVDNAGNWYVRGADGSRTAHLKQANWSWDGSTSQWARFWVIVHPSAVWSAEDTWGAGTWGETGTVGSTATYDDVQALRAIVADWKPDGTRCMQIILAFDAASFDPIDAPGAAGLPDGLWGAWSKLDAGVQVPARLSTARYLDGAER